jgi:hypothetical protein
MSITEQPKDGPKKALTAEPSYLRGPDRISPNAANAIRLTLLLAC